MNNKINNPQSNTEEVVVAGTTNIEEVKIKRTRAPKKTTSTGKKFVGSYVSPIIDELNNEHIKKTGRTSSANIETMIAIGLAAIGYKDRIEKEMPQLKYLTDYSEALKRIKGIK